MAALALSACTTGAPPVEGGLPRDQAARARPVQEVSESVPPAVRAAGRDPGDAAPPPAGGTGTGTGAGAEPGPYVALLDLPDPTGDNGLRVPDYADLTRVRISSNGPNARMTVRVAAELPQLLAEGEVMGIGIDLYRDASAGESEYQLFAEGSDDGWFAWLHTPKGLGDYEGSFEVGGSWVVFEVPWSALGNRTTGEVRVFLDWSKTAPVLNQTGSDRAPDRGRAGFAR